MKLLLTVVMLCTTALCNTDDAVEADITIGKAEFDRRSAISEVKCELGIKFTKPQDPIDINKMVCVLQTMGIQNKDGTLNEAVFRELMALKGESPEVIENLVNKCVVNANEENAQKTARKIDLCMKDNYHSRKIKISS